MVNKNWIPKFELYFSSNFNAVFCKMIIFMGYWWTLKISILFRKGVLRGAQILKFQIFNTWNSKIRQISKIQWVQQITVSQHITVSNILLCPEFTVSNKILCPPKVAFNIHLFNISFSTCCVHIMLHSV